MQKKDFIKLTKLIFVKNEEIGFLIKEFVKNILFFLFFEIF